MLVCKHCKQQKEVDDFIKKKGVAYPECRVCNRAIQFKSRSKHQLVYNERARLRRHQRKLRAIEYKGGVCMDCNSVVHPAAFDFHHINPTQKDTDPGLMMGCADEVLFKELDKCLLLCSNCHRVRHFVYGY